MTFENTMILDRAANLTGFVVLLSGLIFGAAMFIAQSM
jgi:hypothetical protein